MKFFGKQIIKDATLYTLIFIRNSKKKEIEL